MRHRRNTRNLSRFSSYYKATIHSIAQAVIIHQRIVTTSVRAKLVKRVVDNLISLGKNIDSLADRRRAFSILNDHALVSKLFLEIAPRFKEKNGGYTRIIPYKRRRGDDAELVVLELSMQRVVPKPVKEKKVAKQTEVQQPKAAPQETKKPEVKPEQKPEHVEYKEHKEPAPPEKEKHKKETKKPSKKLFGGFGKFLKPQRDSL